jgi:hypothetical protein
MIVDAALNDCSGHDMAITTYGELKVAVASWLARDDLGASIPAAANPCQGARVKRPPRYRGGRCR